MEENKNVNEQQVQENTSGADTANGSDNTDDAITLESLLAENARLKAESAKNKASLDRALHNNGELTKQLRAKMTASEQEEEAKREREEQIKKHIQDLEDFKRRAEARERYLTLGMSAEHAKLAAEAEVAGDMEELAKVQSQHTAELLKAKEAEWLKSRPNVNAGHGEDSEAEDPFLKGFNKTF